MPSVYINVKISNYTIEALINKGSEANLISRRNTTILRLPIYLDVRAIVNRVSSTIGIVGYIPLIVVDTFSIEYKFTFFIGDTNSILTILSRP